MLIGREELKAEYTDKQIKRLSDKDIEDINDKVWDFVKKLVDGLLIRP